MIIEQSELLCAHRNSLESCMEEDGSWDTVLGQAGLGGVTILAAQ